MNSDFRNSMLAKIHLAKKQLGLSDEDYRMMLDVQFGTQSAADLSMRQLDECLRHLSGLGFQERTTRARKGDKTVPSEGAFSRKAMLTKIEALLAEIGSQQGKHVPWDYATAILKRMFKVQRLEWAKEEQLRAVIAALHRKAYGSTPEGIAESLFEAKRNNPESYEELRAWTLSGLGQRTRAKIDRIIHTRELLIPAQGDANA